MSKPLSWINDPLLFDVEPLQVNKWLNANDLIQQEQGNEIFLSDSQQLKLYPIMIRRIDFVRKKPSDRIMARFPFLVINKDIQEQIIDKILLISEVVRDYFYKSINKSILQWKLDILKYLAKGCLPFPIVRCCFEFSPNVHVPINDTSLRFTSARGEPFKMPTKLTKELAYLAGMVNGDGNLQKYTLRIVDYSIKNIKQLQAMFQEYFDQTGNIIYKTPNSPEVVITNLWVVRLFSFLTGQPIGIKKYGHLGEPLIFKQEPNRSYYWSGVMDADGSYKKSNVTFVSASLRFATDFKIFLSENKISSKLTEREDNTVYIYIPSLYHDKLKELLICLHPEKKEHFDKITHSHTNMVTFFDGYRNSSLINGYFNFRLINNLSVNGLGQLLRLLRGSLSRKAFVEKLTLNEKTLQAIEVGTMSINILHLDDILKINNLQLMPYLTQQKSIRFHIRGSKRVKLDTQPNEQLASLLKPLTFHKHSVTIPKTHLQVKQAIENHFDISLQTHKITSKILLKFFRTFIEVK